MEGPGIYERLPFLTLGRISWTTLSLHDFIHGCSNGEGNMMLAGVQMSEDNT